MEIFPSKDKKTRVCGPEAKGRILNYDQKGRSLRLLLSSGPREQDG
jgi:hypothetical protein